MSTPQQVRSRGATTTVVRGIVWVVFALTILVGVLTLVFGTTDVVVVLTTVGGAAAMLTQAALCAAVAVLAWRVPRRNPFRRSVSLAVTCAGAILLVGGMISQAANSIATGLAASELNVSGSRGFWPLAGRFDPTFLVIGVVLLLVGLAFEYGERLVRDTDGLV